MKTLVPDYYKEFRCIAEKCKHNCCIGWEIDIDEDTLSYYENVEDSFHNKLMQDIEYNDESAYFRLDGKGRCAFLNEDNLCEIILNLGEDALCQICSDHPRFRNYYTDRIEMGLGLCCEEAGRIILGHKAPFSLKIISDDNSHEENDEAEIEFFKFRNELFEMLNSDNLTLQEKVLIISKECNYDVSSFTLAKWIDLFLSLERLDDNWTVILNQLSEADISDIDLPNHLDLHFENLIKYFIYRHLQEKDDFKTLAFILISYEIIMNICKMHIKNYKQLDFTDIVEYCRLYSSEIEYSDVNIDEIKDSLE